MKRLIRLLEDLIWPRCLKCLCCDALSEGELLCSNCQRALKMLKLKPEDRRCDFRRSVYRYEGVAKRLVILLKLECAADASIPLAEGIAERIVEMNLPPDTILTWVTMPEMRRQKRGIDHGRTLCEAVGRKVNLPVRQLLVRTGKIHTQRGLNRIARQRNLVGSFKCEEQISSPVLLIDDVMTTGATTAECAAALIVAGAPKVSVLTATQVPRKHG